MLTGTQIAELAWTGKHQRVAAGVPGLGLQLQVRKHSKTWIVRRKVQGRPTITTVGH
jgi:hypothetical protein